MGKILAFPKSARFAARWQESERLIANGDYEEALKRLQELATEGYIEAYVEIGNLFELGVNDEGPDFDAAYSWYSTSIEEENDPFAYVGIARLILNGFTLAGTTDRAIEYLEYAISKDNVVAMIILGTLYQSGKVVEQNVSRAEHLYKSAIEAGYVLPLFYLASLNRQQGHFLKYCINRTKAAIVTLRTILSDPNDVRLWNVVRRR